MSQSDFDSEKLRIDRAKVSEWTKGARPHGSRQRSPGRKGKFLAGPIPLTWLTTAAQLPGKALSVGLALWFLRGCQKRATVRLTRQTLEQFGVSRKAGYRGLELLEAAGLVEARRHVGRSPWVTIRLQSKDA
jgi:hypothetical protein